jgi:hypothetical protein
MVIISLEIASVVRMIEKIQPLANGCIKKGKCMKGYIKIQNEADIENLLAKMGGFHDSMTKEVHMVNRGYVEQDGSMIMPDSLDAQVLIHSQTEPFAIELLFISIKYFEINDAEEYWSANAWVEQEKNTDLQTIHFDFDSDFRIIAKELYCRDRSDWIGPAARLGFEVPSPAAISAIRLDGTWRQCSGCADAFEADEESVYVLCPKCGCLTKIE